MNMHEPTQQRLIVTAPSLREVWLRAYLASATANPQISADAAARAANTAVEAFVTSFDSSGNWIGGRR